MSKYFTDNELKCKCCGDVHMMLDFMESIDRAREKSMIPWIIISGWRCPNHDAEEGGEGNHPTGRALDIQTCSSYERYRILTSLIEEKFNRFGIAKDFIHVDDVDRWPKMVIWTY